MSGESNGDRLREIPGTCPDPRELGVSGWNILHSSAAVYPYKPSAVQQTAMKNFIESWASVYACSWCAYHMRDYVKSHPPVVTDKLGVSRYVCELHNEVNERIGNELYDCSPEVVLRRWHPGYPDKMEDKPTIEEQLAAAALAKSTAAAAQQRERAEEERRFSDFDLRTRDSAPREATGWRVTEATARATPSKASSSDAGKGWWFFGSSAFSSGGNSRRSRAAVADQAPSPVSADANGVHGAGFAGKAADDETDVEAVLSRLKRCQVYCPEDQELQKH